MVRVDSSPVGIWKLISMTIEDDGGREIFPFGKDTGGLIMIDAKGYFSAQVMNMKRPIFKIPDPRAGTTDEVKKAFEEYIGYYGTFDLDKTEGKITFHVKGAWMPNWIGENQIRYYKIEGSKMTISTAPVLFGGKNRIAKLVWEQIE